MKYYITHIVADKVPEKNYRQISFLCADNESYAKGIYYYGYDGSRRLTEAQLSEEINEGKIVRLSRPITVESKKYLWLDSKGKLWTSNDNLLKEGKESVGLSGLKPNSMSEAIFKEKFKSTLNKVQKRTSIVI